MIRNRRGITYLELVVLLFIGLIVVSIAVPKFIAATNLRRAKEMTLILNRLFQAQYTYHHKNGHFSADINDLPVSKSDLSSTWFSYTVEYASKDTFYLEARVKRAFGKASTEDWAGISSARIRTISNPQTLGVYTVEWMALIRKERARKGHKGR
jgi:type II secretory pathway pseudopilin PulG